MLSEWVKKIKEDKDLQVALGGIALCAIGLLLVFEAHPVIGGPLLLGGIVAVMTALDRMEAGIGRG